ncbi:MAG: bifunctional serine/threonine-protein kinase/formylglycine-generating enzyme family protein [Myxococcota bacterium]
MPPHQNVDPITSNWTPTGDEPTTADRGPTAKTLKAEHTQALLTDGLDRYELRTRLGAGGMGEVYYGIHRTIEKEVAIKVLAYEHRHDPISNDRFLEEAKAASMIRHDNVVDITDFGYSPQGCAYFVMEYLEGEDLAATLRREAPLPWARTRHIVLQLLRALEVAHARGIVHRDIKPANCMRCYKNGDPDFIKVLDFGIARMTGLPQECLTTVGTVIGTASYMAPEQARAQPVSARTDLYAVGVMLFRMVTGRLPFRAESPVELLAKHMRQTPPLASTMAPRPIPDGVDRLIARALAKDPADRWESAEQMAAAVAAIAFDAEASREGNPLGPTATTPGVVPAPPGTTLDLTASADPERRRWIPAAIAACTAVAAIVAVGFAPRGPVDQLPASDLPSVGAPPPAEQTNAAANAASRCPDGMVWIEGGSFFMGADDDDIPALQTARPPHKVHVEPYCIDIDEVQVFEFRECSDQGQCHRAFRDSWWPPGTLDQAEWNRRREALGTLCNARTEHHDLHPINCVTWAQARDYCEFQGQRLPTEAEWEFAARGSDGRIFPWGDQPPTASHGNLCNTECTAWRADHGLSSGGALSDADDGWPGTAPVGSFLAGTSQYGLHDLVGNVFEWTASDFALYDGHPEGVVAREGKVIRGGAFNSINAMFANPALRFSLDPKAHTHGVGFRCAADPRK